ncbi:MAG: hypothetical protein Q9182_005825 [Xanthomendoza sp. 2 TL-2023]
MSPTTGGLSSFSSGRSPCPALNALANHGYLPRNGRNISSQQFIRSIEDVFNFEEKITTGIVRVYQPFTTTGNNNTLNLNDLDHHNPGEFDGSLSRSDLALGDNHSFNETIWNSVAAHFHNTTISIATAAKAHKDRFAAAQAANKEFTGTADAGRGTTALYLLVMRGQFRETKTRFVQIFFRQDRIPFNEGWRRSNRTITMEELNGLVEKIKAAE